MKRTESFDHEGWFGICPVYIGDLDSDAPRLTPRMDNTAFHTLFWISHWAFMAFFAAADLVAPKWQPGFPLMVTGELEVPYLYEWDDTEDTPE